MSILSLSHPTPDNLRLSASQQNSLLGVRQDEFYTCIGPDENNFPPPIQAPLNDTDDQHASPRNKLRLDISPGAEKPALHGLRVVDVPLGWKRLLSNGIVTYFSPSNVELKSMESVINYIKSNGTCKCGLECPFKVEKLFSFDGSVSAKHPELSESVEVRSRGCKCSSANRKTQLVESKSAKRATPANQNVLETDGKKKPRGRNRASANPYDGMLVSQLLAQREKLLKETKSSACRSSEQQTNVPAPQHDAAKGTVQEIHCPKTSSQAIISTVSASSTVQVSVSNSIVQPIPSSSSYQNAIGKQSSSPMTRSELLQCTQTFAKSPNVSAVANQATDGFVECRNRNCACAGVPKTDRTCSRTCPEVVKSSPGQPCCFNNNENPLCPFPSCTIGSGTCCSQDSADNSYNYHMARRRNVPEQIETWSGPNSSMLGNRSAYQSHYDAECKPASMISNTIVPEQEIGHRRVVLERKDCNGDSRPLHQMPPVSTSTNVTIVNSSLPHVLPPVGIPQPLIPNTAPQPSTVLQVVNMYTVDTMQGPMIVQNSVGNAAMSNGINFANTFPQGVQPLSPNNVCVASTNEHSHNVINRPPNNCGFGLPNQQSAKYWVNNVNNATIAYAPAENTPILLSPNSQVVPAVNGVVQSHQAVYHNQGMTQVLSSSATSHISAYNAQSCVAMIPTSVGASQLLMPNQAQGSYPVLPAPISPLAALQKQPLVLNQNAPAVFVNAQPSPNAIPHGQSVMQAVTIVPSRLPSMPNIAVGSLPQQQMITYQSHQVVAPVQSHLIGQNHHFPTEPFHQNPAFTVVQPQSSLATIFPNHGEAIAMPNLPIHTKTVCDDRSASVVHGSPPTVIRADGPPDCSKNDDAAFGTDDPDSTTCLGDEADGKEKRPVSPGNRCQNDDAKTADDANNFKVCVRSNGCDVATSSDACDCDESSALVDPETGSDVRSTVSNCYRENGCSIVFTDSGRNAAEEDKVSSDTNISESCSSDGQSSDVSDDEDDSSSTSSPTAAEMFYPSVIELAKSLSSFEGIICVGAEQTCASDDKADAAKDAAGSSPSTSKESSDSGVESGQEPPLISSNRIDSTQSSIVDPVTDADVDVLQGMKKRGAKRRRRELSLLQRSAEGSSPFHNSEDDCETVVDFEPRSFNVGDLVWGQIRGFPSWPGKLVSHEQVKGVPASCNTQLGKLWVKWFGNHTCTQVEPEKLKTLSEGLEAHHRARKKHRRGRKMNCNLENAIQEAMKELDKQMGDDDTFPQNSQMKSGASLKPGQAW